MLNPYRLQMLLYFSTFLSFHLFHHPKITVRTLVRAYVTMPGYAPVRRRLIFSLLIILTSYENLCI